MLPLGRKNARKCLDCNITCHANCAHLVPDFCGMSMETANELLRNWRDINRLRGDRAAKLPRHHTDQAPTSTQSLDTPMGQLKLSTPESAPSITDARPASVPPPSERYPDPRYYQSTSPPPQQQQLPSAQQTSGYGQPRPIQGPPPGARIPMTPGFPQEQVIPSRVPVPYDTIPLGHGLESPYGPGSGYQV